MNVTNPTLLEVAQQRHENQSTFYRYNVSPLLKNTFIYHDYSYGWIPETAVWNSAYEDLDVRDYYPITLGLLNKFEFLFNLYQGPVPQYSTKINSPFVNQIPRVSFNDYFKQFAILPKNEFISFLLLTSIPIYNILYFFKTTNFDPKLHSLFNSFYVNNDKHVELARYLIKGGDYKPIFNRLNQPGLYDGTLAATNMYTVVTPSGVSSQRYAIELESLSNISALITHTKKDPVFLFLLFYLPGLSVTTSVTPAVLLLMNKLGMDKKNVVLV